VGVKPIIPDMTYNVFGGTLNLTQPSTAPGPQRTPKPVTRWTVKLNYVLDKE